VIVSRLRAARVDRESVAAVPAEGRRGSGGSPAPEVLEAELEFDETDEFSDAELAADLPDQDLDDDSLADSAPRGPRPRE
jgi:hypothetical protein